VCVCVCVCVCACVCVCVCRYGSDDGGGEAANLPPLDQLRADELDMDPRLMHVDVVAELVVQNC
jgi:hypothetical protein